MTIGVNNRNDALGADNATVYPYGFKVFAASDLEVKVRDANSVETTLLYPTQYSVSNIGNRNGGNVTLSSVGGVWQNTDGTLKTGYSITIRRVRPLTQTSDIRNQGGFFADVHEDTFDHLVMIDQQQQDEIDRSIKLPSTEDGSYAATALPSAASRASKWLAFDSSGNVIVTDAQSASGTSVTSTGSTTARLLASRAADFCVVEDFGAIGNGATDDRAAWQAALNDGRDVWCLNKAYLIGTPGLSVPVGRKGLVIRGMYKDTQLLANGAYGIINFPAGATTRNTLIEGIQFGATGAGDGAATGLAGSADLNYVMFADIRRCTFSAKLRYGITGSWIVSEFDRCNFGTLDQPTAGKIFKAFKLRSSAGGGNAFQSMLTFNQCEFNNANDDYVCELEWSMSNHFYRCTWEGNNPTVGVFKMIDCVLNKFERCWAEQNPVHPPAVAGMPFVKGFDGAHPLDVRYEFDGCYFEGLGAGANDVVLDNTNNASKQYTLENTQLSNVSHFNLDTGNYDLPQNCARLVNNKSAGAATLWVENWYQFRSTLALTMTGCTVPIVVVADIQKVGDMVTVEFSTFAGTSNAVGKTITGLNNIASLLPATAKPFIPMMIIDNGAAPVLAYASLSAAGVLTIFTTPGGGAWTAAGTSQVIGTCFTYSIK